MTDPKECGVCHAGVEDLDPRGRGAFCNRCESRYLVPPEGFPGEGVWVTGRTLRNAARAEAMVPHPSEGA